MHASGMPMPDYHDFLNSVSPSPTSVPGHVSFDVRITGDESKRHTIRNETLEFVGRFVPGRAHIDFRVRDDGKDIVYHSVGTGQTTVSGGIGHERNGRFFS